MKRDGNYLAADQRDLEPQDRRGPRAGQCRPAHASGRQARRRQCPCSPTTMRDGTVEQSHGRPRERRPDRGAARHASRRHHHARECDLFAVPGYDRQRLPQAAELGDYRGSSDRRSGTSKVRFSGGRLQLFGVNASAAAGIQHLAGPMRAPQAGWSPISAHRAKKGFELAIPYHWQIDPNRDLTLTPHLYTGVLPAIEVKYRELNSIGAYPGRRLPHLRHDRQRQSAHRLRPTDGIRAYFEEQRASSSSIRCGASPVRSASRATKP